jgi:hypothetical protein
MTATAQAVNAMALAVVLHGCMVSMARSEEWAIPSRMTVHHDAPPGAGWFARVVIENRIGTYNATEVLETAHGPVGIEYTTTPPFKVGDPASADRVCAVSLPPGVLAVPECLDVMEQDRGEMLLLKWIGG